MIKGQRKVRGIRDKLKPGEIIGRVPTGAQRKGAALILPPSFKAQVIDTQVAYTGTNATTYDSVSDAIDGAFSLALPVIPDGDVLANISGSSALPVGNTLTAVLDHVFGTTRGSILFRGATGWTSLPPGTDGFFLKTFNDPVWAQTVTAVTVAGGFRVGLTQGGTITGTGTIDYITQSDGTVLANITGSSNVPSETTITALLDHVFGSTQGDILYRNASGWVVLAPGTSGQVLQTGGASANPSWVTSAALSNISDGQVLSNISGSSALPSGNGLSAVLDHVFSSTQGAVLYRGASAWAALAPGTNGQVLTTGGASANPSWTTPTSASGAITLIQEVVTTGSQANVTFSSIASTYRDLIVVVRGRSGTIGSTLDNVALQFNSDTTAGHYQWQQFYTSGSTPSAGQSLSDSSIVGPTLPGDAATAGYSGGGTIRILDYRGTTFNKTVLSEWNSPLNSISARVGTTGGIWLSTAAINAVKVFTYSNSAWKDGTVISLYGSN